MSKEFWNICKHKVSFHYQILQQVQLEPITLRIFARTHTTYENEDKEEDGDFVAI
jgi:hypothetical protein